MKKNLTDDEIVQTFENCINGKCKGDCAYRTTKECCDMKQLHRDALDLLHRLQDKVVGLELDLKMEKHNHAVTKNFYENSVANSEKIFQEQKTRIEQLEEARDYWREAAATLGG